MASVINTNNASLVAQRNLDSRQTELTNSVQRLSSGLRINSAKDDAAGLGISQKLQSQISGANVSARNANDAISMVQTAEGGMQEMSNMLQRMRDLATQGNNDSLNDTQRGYIATEMVMAIDEAVRDKIIAGIPAGRLGEPSEIARCVTFLASEDAGFISGSTISANGAQFFV